MLTSEFLFRKSPGLALFYGDRKITYTMLHEILFMLKQDLRSKGVASCSHVGLCIKNPLVFILTYLALWDLGVAIVSLDTQGGSKDYVDLINYADLNYLLTDKVELKDRLLELLKNNSLFYGFLLLRSEDCSISFYQTAAVDRQLDSLSKDNIMLFTSGSSGRPKAVVLRKDSIIRNIKKVIGYTRLTKDDNTIMTLPLSYSYGLSQTLAHLIVGGSVGFSKNNFSPLLLLAEVEQYCATNYSATPYFYNLLSDLLKNNQPLPTLKKFRFFMNAGGFISTPVIKSILSHYSNVVFFNNYGQTEAAPRLSYARFTFRDFQEFGVGKPLDGVDLIILNEAGERISDGEIGEIAYRSEDMMSHYYKGDKFPFNSSGFFLSGDLGFFDQRGHLQIVGRKDSMIKVNGRKIYLQAIENKIMKTGLVRCVKLKKENHESLGEYICAYVVPSQSSSNVNDRRVYETHFRESLTLHEMPKKIIVIEDMVISPNGKIRV